MRSPRRTHRVAAASLAVTLLLGAFASFAAATPAPSGSKGGEATADGSSTEVTAGGSVDWTVTADNSGDEPSTISIVDTIGAGQTFDPSGTAAGPDWTLEYSDTGAAGPYGDAPGAGTRAVRATSPLLPNNLLGSTGQLPTPATQADLSLTDGDGWIPIVTDDRIFNVMHHTHPGEFDLNCTVRATGARCDDYPKELSAYTPGDVLTPQSPRAVIDDQDRLWIPVSVDIVASTADEGGLYCFDTTTNAPCATAFYPLTTVTIGTAGSEINRSPVGGASLIADRVYMSAARNVVGTSAVQAMCFDTTTLTACGVTDMNSVGLPAWNYSNVPDGRAPWIQTETVGARMYFTVDYGGSQSLSSFDSFGNRVLCFDSSTDAPCAGWATPAAPGTSGDNLVRLTSMLLENPQHPGEMCVGTTVVDTTLIASIDAGLVFVPALTSRTIDCFDAGGVNAPARVPTGMQALINSVPQYMFTNYSYREPVSIAYEEEYTAPGRVVIPMAVARLNAQTETNPNTWVPCYDEALDGACAGFGTAGVATFPSVGGGAIQIYGFSRDQAGCLWGLGHQGWLFSVNPGSGDTPCTQANVDVTVASAADYYCRTENPAVTWGTASVTDVPTGDITAFTVDVLDAAGDPVPGFTGLVGTGGVVDLAGLPGGPEYQFRSTVTTIDASPWAGGSPGVAVSFTGPPVELCLRTIVSDECTAPSTVTNDAAITVTDVDGSATIDVASSMTVTGIPACPTSSTTSTTTSSSSTTTTTSPPPTTTAPTTTGPSSSTTAPSPAPTTPTGDVSGNSASTGRSASGQLPRTGTGTGALALGAVLCLLAGTVLLAARRRR